MLSTTVLAVERELEAELADLGASLWIAALPQRALEMARRSPDWDRWRAPRRSWGTVAEAAQAYESGRRRDHAES
jgi:hypothetical protein